METENRVNAEKEVIFNFTEADLKAIAKRKSITVSDSDKIYKISVIPDNQFEKYILFVNDKETFNFHVGQSFEEVLAFLKYNKRLKDWFNGCGSLGIKATIKIIY